MCGTLSGAGPSESLRKSDFLGNTSQGCSRLPPAEHSAASGAVSKWLECVSKGSTIPGVGALALRDQNMLNWKRPTKMIKSHLLALHRTAEQSHRVPEKCGPNNP